MIRTKTSEYISLVGTSLAIFGYLFGLWSGVLSGLDLFIDILNTYSKTITTGDAYYDTVLINIIVGLFLVLIVQIIVTIYEIRTKNETMTLLNFLSSIIGLISLGILFIKYDAYTSGPILTSLGEGVVLFSTASRIIIGYQIRFMKRRDTAAKHCSSWQVRLANAKLYNTPVSILSITTSKFLIAKYRGLLIEELRSHDAVIPVCDGAYILLWKTNAETAKIVATHLQNFLLQYQIQSQIGIASFPKDSEEICKLVQYSDQALQEAMKPDNLPIINYKS